MAPARQRLRSSHYPYFLLADSPDGRAKEAELAGKPLPPAETQGDIKQGFVYERVAQLRRVRSPTTPTSAKA